MKSGPPLLFLVLLSAVSPLSTDIYTPAFPSLAASLDAPESLVQLTFSTFIIGMGVGQLIVGPLSDGLGRRRFLVGGAAGFVILTLLCATSPTIEALIGWRLAQGLAGAACIVMARATITDFFPPPIAAKRFSTVAAFQSLAPVIGPVIGGVILVFGDWRTVFFVIAGIGAVSLVGSILFFPETLTPERRNGARLRDNGRRIVTLLRNRVFIGYVITSCLACAGFFTYIAGAPLVLNAVFGTTPLEYAIFFASNSLGMGVAISVIRILTGRVSTERLLLVGLVIITTAASVFLVAVIAGVASLPVTWACLFVVASSMGLINPTGLILSQRAGAALAGTAAALHGGLQFISGALASPSTGLHGHDSLLPMALIVFSFVTLALVSNRVGAAYNSRHGSGGAA